MLVLGREGFFLVAATGSYSQAAACRLIVVASLAAGHGLEGAWASVVAAHELSSCGSWALEHSLSSRGAQAQLLLSMWDLSRSGIKPRSPALAGGFFTTEPLGKPICPYTTYINATKGEEKKESIVTRQNFTKSAMEGLSELSFHWGLEAK